MGQIVESILEAKGVTMTGPDGTRHLELPKRVESSVTIAKHKRTKES